MFSNTISVFSERLFSMDKRIAVIGAGAAGIASATKLIEHGFSNVTIIEAEKRTGGRLYTTPFGANVVDIGGQWYGIILICLNVKNPFVIQFNRVILSRKTMSCVNEKEIM